MQRHCSKSFGVGRSTKDHFHSEDIVRLGLLLGPLFLYQPRFTWFLYFQNSFSVQSVKILAISEVPNRGLPGLDLVPL